MSELQSRGLDYRVVARVQNTDVEVPRSNATFDDLRLTDHDIILARGDVTAEPDLSGRYQTSSHSLIINSGFRDVWNDRIGV